MSKFRRGPQECRQDEKVLSLGVKRLILWFRVSPRPEKPFSDTSSKDGFF